MSGRLWVPAGAVWGPRNGQRQVMWSGGIPWEAPGWERCRGQSKRLPGGRGVHTETRRRRSWTGHEGAQRRKVGRQPGVG